MTPEIENNPLPRTPTAGAPESPPLAELVERVSADIQQLTRQEAALAKRELGESLQAVKLQAGAMAAGGAVLAGGLLTLLAAAVLALATVLPAWSAALAVGLLVSALGLALVLTGKARLAKVNLTPERTLENVERDLRAIKRAAT